MAATFSANGAQLALATLLSGKTRKPRVLTVLEWPGGRLLQQVGQGGDHMSLAIGFTAKDRLVERNSQTHTD